MTKLVFKIEVDDHNEEDLKTFNSFKIAFLKAMEVSNNEAIERPIKVTGIPNNTSTEMLTELPDTKVKGVAERIEEDSMVNDPILTGTSGIKFKPGDRRYGLQPTSSGSPMPVCKPALDDNENLLDITGDAWNATIHHADKIKTPTGKWRKKTKSKVVVEPVIPVDPNIPITSPFTSDNNPVNSITTTDLVNPTYLVSFDDLLIYVTTNKLEPGVLDDVTTFLTNNNLKSFSEVELHPQLLPAIARIVGYSKNA